ncbi:MAG TPA: cyclic peptide export ABC transporter [Blastocatellia bacterium]|jgi:putative ATP-binding cassette transporter|nr:cyclic peptide export ABC transporter [Blastocatellia bacterium]
MRIFSFLIRYSRRTLVVAIIAGILSGASNIALLAVVNTALRNDGRQVSGLLWIFIALCVSLPVTRFVSECMLARLGQQALFELRMRLSRKILATPLRRIEELGAHRLLASLTDDIPKLTDALLNIPILSINIAVIISSLVYLGWLSGIALVVMLGFMALGILTYQLPIIRARRSFRLAREEGDALFRHFRMLTEGIKDLQLHFRRRRDFLDKLLRRTALAVSDHNIRGMTTYTAAASWGQALSFVVIGLIIFGLPALHIADAHTLTGYVLAILYMMSPLQVTMNIVPSLSKANVALKKLEDVGLSLAAQLPEEDGHIQPGGQPRWDRLELTEVTHVYTGDAEDHGFVFGPVSLGLSRGELVFLVGGNGSGKTTLAKLLTGLYLPDAGEVRLDDRLITNDDVEYYRQHFSAVFSDFYLTDTFLGLDATGIEARAREYLKRLELDHKVRVTEEGLSTVNLSQGQRKRLALLIAYLEDRPIYVFDEWAADQDQMFKEVFYYRILPDLKARGKTVLVISHDDKYYHVADRIIKLDYGRIEYDTIAVPAFKGIDVVDSHS